MRIVQIISWTACRLTSYACVDNLYRWQVYMWIYYILSYRINIQKCFMVITIRTYSNYAINYGFIRLVEMRR